MRRLIAMAALAAVLAPTFAFAQEPTRASVIDNRQARQERRIDAGIENGQINQREAARLNARENRIDRMENRALSDGSVSRREFRRIETAQNRTSRAIRHQRHDRQTAR